MFDRKVWIGLAVAGVVTAVPAATFLYAADAVPTSAKADQHEKDDEHEGGEHGEHEHGKHHDAKHHEKHEDEDKDDEDGKEIEQPVPMAFVPAAVLDVVKKEVLGGTITEAELEAKKGRIVYSFDVKAGDIAYDVKVSVDGKFISKEVDDGKDEDVEKPAAGEKK